MYLEIALAIVLIPLLALFVLRFYSRDPHAFQKLYDACVKNDLVALGELFAPGHIFGNLVETCNGRFIAIGANVYTVDSADEALEHSFVIACRLGHNRVVQFFMEHDILKDKSDIVSKGFKTACENNQWTVAHTILENHLSIHKLCRHYAGQHNTLAIHIAKANSRVALTVLRRTHPELFENALEYQLLACSAEVDAIDCFKAIYEVSEASQHKLSDSDYKYALTDALTNGSKRVIKYYLQSEALQKHFELTPKLLETRDLDVHEKLNLIMRVAELNPLPEGDDRAPGIQKRMELIAAIYEKHKDAAPALEAVSKLMDSFPTEEALRLKRPLFGPSNEKELYVLALLAFKRTMPDAWQYFRHLLHVADFENKTGTITPAKQQAQEAIRKLLLREIGSNLEHMPNDIVFKCFTLDHFRIFLTRLSDDQRSPFIRKLLASEEVKGYVSEFGDRKSYERLTSLGGMRSNFNREHASLIRQYNLDQYDDAEFDMDAIQQAFSTAPKTQLAGYPRF